MFVDQCLQDRYFKKIGVFYSFTDGVVNHSNFF